MNTFNVAGITFAIKENSQLEKLKPNGIVKFIPEPGNVHDANAIQIKLNDLFLGYVPKGRYQKLAKKLKTGRISSYKYHHPDWEKLKIPKWNDDHIGNLKSIEIVLESDEPENKVIGGRYMRVTSLLSYLSEQGNFDGLLMWAFSQGSTYQEYSEKLKDIADSGTVMHEAIENYFKNSITDNPNLPKGWNNFVEKFEPIPLQLETRFWDNKLMVSGCPDFVGVVKYKDVDTSCVIDWKSSKKCKIKFKIQASIYAKNCEVAGEQPPEKAFIICFGADNKQGYSVTVLDREEIENYYLVARHLQQVIDLANCPKNKNEYL